MSEKNFYNNYEYQDDYEMRCDCKYDYDEQKSGEPCDCEPDGNCCNGITFDDPIVNKDVIIDTLEVFDSKLSCSIPIPEVLPAPVAADIVTQRYVPIEDCGCKSCDSLSFDTSAIYRVEKSTIKICEFVTTSYAGGSLNINEDTVTTVINDTRADVVDVPLYAIPSLYKNNCDKICKGTKSTLLITGVSIDYKPVVELCGTVFTCGRKAKFFITIEYAAAITPTNSFSVFVNDLCIPSLCAFDKPYLQLSSRAEASMTSKPTIKVTAGTSSTACLPTLSFTGLNILLRGVLQSKVLVPVQRLVPSKGLFIPDNFEQCCNIPNVYPSQVEDRC